LKSRDDTRDARFTHAFLLLFLIVGVALHAAYIVHHRVNIDEPQHLHVAWAWGHGLLPYRDVFDNHSPLFSFLMAPMVRAIGERADIVRLARLAMVPFAIATLAITWVVGRRLFSGPAALLAVALAALAPDFMLGSVEYRTDQLWMALWMGTMALVLLGRMTRARSLVFGLALGATLGASMKTSLWIVSLAAAVTACTALVRRRGMGLRPAWVAERVALALAGTAVVPVMFAVFFTAHDSLRQMIYCVLWHNLVPGLGFWHTAQYRALIIPVALPLLWIVARQIVDRSPDPGVGARRAVLFLTASIYYVALEGFWPLVTRQDVLPVLPLGAVVVAPLLLGLAMQARSRASASWAVRAMCFAPALALIAEVAWTQRIEAVWRDNDVTLEAAFLSHVLRLTRPGDPVMDLRGETIFRPRPIYYALEAVTLKRMEDGLIPDDISERLIATRTPVAVPDSPDFPARSRAFMNRNYLLVGDLRVAGKSLEDEEDHGVRRFDIAIPQRYAVVCDHGPAKGLLDGVPYRGPRDLAQGRHSYSSVEGEGRGVVIWSQAVATMDSPLR